MKVKVLVELETECPCGKLVQIGHRVSDGAPFVLHREPTCTNYDEFAPDEFVKWLRLHAEGKLDS